MVRFLVTSVTFGVFMAEAIIHYNMGKSDNGKDFKLNLSPPKEMAKIAAITGAFAVASGVLIGSLQSFSGNKK